VYSMPYDGLDALKLKRGQVRLVKIPHYTELSKELFI
jgi:hypothetical protein